MVTSTRSLRLTETEARNLTSRLRHSTFLLNRAIGLSVEPHNEPFVMNDGSKLPSVNLVITADTPELAAMGYGFVTAISEGVHKLEGAS